MQFENYFYMFRENELEISYLELILGKENGIMCKRVIEQILNKTVLEGSKD